MEGGIGMRFIYEIEIRSVVSSDQEKYETAVILDALRGAGIDRIRRREDLEIAEPHVQQCQPQLSLRADFDLIKELSGLLKREVSLAVGREVNDIIFHTTGFTAQVKRMVSEIVEERMRNEKIGREVVDAFKVR